MNTYDQSAIDSLFGVSATSPVGFGGGFAKNPLVYAFDKKKKRTLLSGQIVNSVRGRLLSRFAGQKSFFSIRTHGVRYGNDKNYIQPCAKAFGEECVTCSYISNVWESSRASGIRASAEDAHRAGKLSLRKDSPADVWMNFLVEYDPQVPENNGRVFAYRLPAIVRDEYNKAIIGGTDAMGRVIEAYDPAHPINGCSIEVVATYADNKTTFSVLFGQREPLFGGDIEKIKAIVSTTHDLEVIVKQEARLDKAQGALEYFLRSYQPQIGAGRQQQGVGLFNGGPGQGGQVGQGGFTPQAEYTVPHGGFAPQTPPPPQSTFIPQNTAFSTTPLSQVPPPPASSFSSGIQPVQPMRPASQFAPPVTNFQQQTFQQPGHQLQTPSSHGIGGVPSKNAFDDLEGL